MSDRFKTIREAIEKYEADGPEHVTENRHVIWNAIQKCGCGVLLMCEPNAIPMGYGEFTTPMFTGQVHVFVSQILIIVFSNPGTQQGDSVINTGNMYSPTVMGRGCLRPSKVKK